MDEVELITRVNQFYEDVWSPERNQLIQFLLMNEKELQEQKKQHLSNSVTCSKASVVSGGLTLIGLVAGPATGGLSLLLTTAGTATGVVSGIAGIANDINHSGVVQKNWEKALESIGKHIETCETMVALLEQLQKITGVQMGIKSVQFFKTLRTMWSIFSKMRQLIKELKALHAHILSKNPQTMAKFTKRFAKNGILTVGGIAWDTYAICSGEDELAKLNNGNLCTDAKKLNELRINLQTERENIEKVVRDIMSLRRST